MRYPWNSVHGLRIPCGGLAVVVHGFPRFTKDIDVLILEADLEAAKTAAANVGFDIESGLIQFRAGQADEEKVYCVVKIEGTAFLMLDLILVSPTRQDVWDDRIQLQVDGKPIRVVSRKGLIKMKRAAGRPVDLADLANLESSEEST